MKNTPLLGISLLALGACTNTHPRQGIERLVDVNQVDITIGVDSVDFEEHVFTTDLFSYHGKELLLLFKQGNPLFAEHMHVSSYQYLDVAGYVTKKEANGTSYQVTSIPNDNERQEIQASLERYYSSFPIIFSN